MAEERILRSIVDPDFGPLDLVETRTLAAVDGGPAKPLVFRTWRSATGAPGPSILISDGDDLLRVSEDVREVYRRVACDLDGLKAQVARSQLELAKEWADSGDIEIDLTEGTFANLLVLDGYTVDPGRVTVWLCEPAGIFAGHLIEVRIEHGRITEICLAG